MEHGGEAAKRAAQHQHDKQLQQKNDVEAFREIVILATKVRRGEWTPRQSLTSAVASSKKAVRVENLLGAHPTWYRAWLFGWQLARNEPR
jgi:hypothetical protein